MAHKALRLYLQNWSFFILFLYVLVVFEFFWGKTYKKCASRLDGRELLVGVGLPTAKLIDRAKPNDQGFLVGVGLQRWAGENWARNVYRKRACKDVRAKTEWHNVYRKRACKDKREDWVAIYEMSLALMVLLGEIRMVPTSFFKGASL